MVDSFSVYDSYQAYNSRDNSSTVLLSGGSTFTGSPHLSSLPHVMVVVEADVSGTLYLDFSIDWNNWVSEPLSGYAVEGGKNAKFVMVKGPRWFRVRYVNGSSAQGTFRLDTYFGTFDSPLQAGVPGTASKDVVSVQGVEGMIPVSIQAGDSGTIDAFSRLRVSQPESIFNSKQIFDNQPHFWDDQQTSGSGTSSTHSVNLAASTMSVSNTTAGTRLRQTFQRFNYQPGKSQLIFLTWGNMKTTTGITKIAGYGDDNNGLFFKHSSGTASVVRRTKTSGSVVDNTVAQSSWNIDKMDGTGKSGITLDFAKTQIGVIDFEWLGVGRVRMGFVVDGLIVYCHQFLNANSLSVVYMSTPNLPLRYSIANSGSGAADSFDHICGTVISEGGVQDNGIVFSTNLGSSFVNANTIGTSYALIGIRCKSSTIGETVNIISQSCLAKTNDDFLWEIRLNPTVAGTFAYTDHTGTGVQIALGDTTGNPSTNTVTGGQILRSEYGNGGAVEISEIHTARHLGAAIDGTLDTLVLCVTPLAAGLDIHGSITWRELS